MTRREPALDALRALAILLVLAGHAAPLIQAAVAPGGARIGALFWPSGLLGVEIFFALSGFLIGGLLLEIEAGGATPEATGIFLLRRWMRTLPLYAVMLALLTALPVLDPAPHALLPYATLTQNLAMAPPTSWFAVSWSLSVEEWSYLALPLLAFGVQRGRPGAVARTALLMVLTAGAARLSHLGLAGWDGAVRRAVLCRADAIAYGVLLAACWRYPAWRARLRRAAPAGPLLALAGFWLMPGPFDRVTLENALLPLPLFGAGAALSLVLVLGRRVPRAMARPAAWLAGLSYALYLTQWPALILAHRAGAAAAPWVFAAVSVAAALVLSAAVERPVMRWRPRDLHGAAVTAA